MQIDKSQIISMLTTRGDHEQAGKAESDLPDRVDTEKDSGLLEQLGISPRDLLGKLGRLGG